MKSKKKRGKKEKLDRDTISLIVGVILICLVVVGLLGSVMTAQVVSEFSKAFNLVEGRSRTFTLEGDIYKLELHNINVKQVDVTLRNVDDGQQERKILNEKTKDQLLDIEVEFLGMYTIWGTKQDHYWDAPAPFSTARARFRVARIFEDEIEEPPVVEGVGLEDVLEMLNECEIVNDFITQDLDNFDETTGDIQCTESKVCIAAYLSELNEPFSLLGSGFKSTERIGCKNTAPSGMELITYYHQTICCSV